MRLREIEEEIYNSYKDIQQATEEIFFVLRGMTKIEYLCGDAFISGVKSMLLRERKKEFLKIIIEVSIGKG